MTVGGAPVKTVGHSHADPSLRGAGIVQKHILKRKKEICDHKWVVFDPGRSGKSSTVK